jgi:DNA repair protein RadC
MFSLSNTLNSKDQATVDKAVSILEKRAEKSGMSMENSDIARKYFQLKLASLKREHMAVAYLDEGLRLIRCDIEFAGSINEVPIKPIEIVRKALTLSATNVILSHNHPSGKLGASEGDIHATREIQKVLVPFEINVCDHIIVAEGGTFSFMDANLL